MTDSALQLVREVRERISREFDNDIDKLVNHYISMQVSCLDEQQASVGQTTDQAGENPSLYGEPRKL